MQAVSPAAKAAILSANTDVSWGVDLLDLDDMQIGDEPIPATECSVMWNGYADIHRTVSLTVAEALDWPNVRVRPWQEIGGQRFYSGVFGLQIPESATQTGVWTVQGADKLKLLQRNLPDSYWLAKSTGGAPTFYLAGARQAILDSGLTGTGSRIQSDADAVELVDDMVWAFDTQSPTTYLRVTNDFVAQVGYRALWMTGDGAPTSIPYRKPIERASEWDFVAGVNATTGDIVLPDRSMMLSDWSRPTAWRFVRNGMATKPIDTAGIYTVGDWDAVDAVRAVYAVDASSQSVLVSRGDQQVITDTSRTRLITFDTAPLPQLDHFDISTYTDSGLGVAVKTQHRSWTQIYHESKVSHVVEVVTDGLG